MRVPRRSGDPAVRVDVFVGGRHVKTVRRPSVKQITLKGLPHRGFTIKLITHYARGRPLTTRKTYFGCPASR